MVSPTIGASINESTYGGVVDSYAAKYGIPLDVFRGVIRNTSNFDPNFKSSTGSGIAGLTNNSKFKINTSDIGTSLDIAGQYLRNSHQGQGDWEKAAQSFLTGNESETLASNEEKLNEQKEPASSDDKAFWRYSMDDWKSFFSRSAWAIIFFITGVLLILASLYVVISKSGDSGK